MADEEKPLSPLEFGTLIHRMILDGPDEELGFGFLESLRPKRGDLPPLFIAPWRRGGWLHEMLERSKREVVVYFPPELPAERWPSQSESIQLMFDSPDCVGHTRPLEGRTTITLTKSRENIKGYEFSFFWDPDIHPDVAASHWPPAIQEVPEFKDWGPIDAVVGDRILELKTYGARRPGKSMLAALYEEPKTYIVEPGETLPFYQQAQQRPWSTPNRKRFKRANRRRK